MKKDSILCIETNTNDSHAKRQTSELRSSPSKTEEKGIKKVCPQQTLANYTCKDDTTICPCCHFHCKEILSLMTSTIIENSLSQHDARFQQMQMGILTLTSLWKTLNGFSNYHFKVFFVHSEHAPGSMPPEDNLIIENMVFQMDERQALPCPEQSPSNYSFKKDVTVCPCCLSHCKEEMFHEFFEKKPIEEYTRIPHETNLLPFESAPDLIWTDFWPFGIINFFNIKFCINLFFKPPVQLVMYKAPTPKEISKKEIVPMKYIVCTLRTPANYTSKETITICPCCLYHCKDHVLLLLTYIEKERISTRHETKLESSSPPKMSYWKIFADFITFPFTYLSYSSDVTPSERTLVVKRQESYFTNYFIIILVVSLTGIIVVMLKSTFEEKKRIIEEKLQLIESKAAEVSSLLALNKKLKEIVEIERQNIEKIRDGKIKCSRNNVIMNLKLQHAIKKVKKLKENSFEAEQLGKIKKTELSEKIFILTHQNEELEKKIKNQVKEITFTLSKAKALNKEIYEQQKTILELRNRVINLEEDSEYWRRQVREQVVPIMKDEASSTDEEERIPISFPMAQLVPLFEGEIEVQERGPLYPDINWSAYQDIWKGRRNGTFF